MPVTGKKKSGRKRNPEKDPDKYFLAYKNPRPNHVKPRKKADKPPKLPKPPKRDPVAFVMEYSHIYDSGDDDTL